ncbi:MAG TPA: GAF domain-containing protein [Verrucomicrobiae bacterium]|nr:GAF domain-containing protein [Verrucomicrobiae bacterium]
MTRLDPTTSGPKPLRDPRLTAINFVADAVNRSLDLKEIAGNALDAILASMNVDAGGVSIWQDTDQALHLFAWHGLSEAFVRQLKVVHKGEDGDVDAVLNGEARIIEDLMAYSRGLGNDAVQAGFHSAVLVPVRAHGFVVGVLGLGTRAVRKFDVADLDLIEVISNQIGNAMVHAQLQADLRASEEQYRALVENSDDAVCIVDARGRPRFANNAFSRIFGYALYEVSQTNLLDHVHADDLLAVRRALDRLFHGESIQNLEYRFRRKDGAWIYVQCGGSVFSREDDRVLEVQLIVRDVTPARQRQQQLLRRNQQLVALTILAEVANSSLKIDEIARNTLEVALGSVGMSGGVIHLADAKQQQLYLYVQTGLPEAMLEQVRTLKWGEGVPGSVAASGQPVVLGDMALEASPVPSLAVPHGFRATIVVPVKAKGELLGTLGLVNRHPVEFAPEVVEMVVAMGNQLGIALANARLYEAQVRENEKLAALVDISSGSAQQLELETLLRRILQRAAELLKADAAYIVRYDLAGEEAEVVAASANFAQLVTTRYPASEGLFGQIRSTRKGRIFTRQEVVEHGYSPLLRGSDVRSALIVPLISRNELIGALHLTRHGEGGADFTPSDLELIQAFASRAAVAIDNAELLKDLERKNELLQLLVEEAHHRIKNNLQMVSGLLQLEVDTTQGGRRTELLQTVIGRIHAIAQVHNLLSEEMPEKVDVHTLMATIVNTVVNSATPSAGPPVVTTEVEHLWLGADQAVPLALIVNELVSNSLLHGRSPAGQPLRAHVQCRAQDGHVHLAVSDNGGGWGREENGPRQGGQGINIVTQLAQVNLRGEFRIESRSDGVRAELRFAIAAHGAGPAARFSSTLAAMRA